MLGTSESTFLRSIKQWFKSSDRMFAPAAQGCINCGRLCRRSGGRIACLCERCETSIPWIKAEDVQCRICGRYELCNDCIRREKRYYRISRSSVRYDEMMKELLARYKYRGDEKLGVLFIEMLDRAYRLLLLDDSGSGSRPGLGKPAIGRSKGSPFDCITYIPLSPERLEERGFNQAEQMAHGIAYKYKLPVLPLLRREKHTEKQSKKSRAGRMADLQGVFGIDENGVRQFRELCTNQLDQQRKLGRFMLKPHKQVGLKETMSPSSLSEDQPSRRSIVLIDDVYTTGSTINHASQLLAECLDVDVYGLAWAR